MWVVVGSTSGGVRGKWRERNPCVRNTTLESRTVNGTKGLGPVAEGGVGDLICSYPFDLGSDWVQTPSPCSWVGSGHRLLGQFRGPTQDFGVCGHKCKSGTYRRTTGWRAKSRVSKSFINVTRGEINTPTLTHPPHSRPGVFYTDMGSGALGAHTGLNLLSRNIHTNSIPRTLLL